MARSGSRQRVVIVAAMVTLGVIGGVGLRHRVQAQPDAGVGAARDPALHLEADLSERKLFVMQGDETVHSYDIAVGQPKYPTPPGAYAVRKIVWNPAWVPPPGNDWARGKRPQPPGAAANPMKVVKIFFKEPAYYIHGTNDPESLGGAESHGCLRMDPDDAYELGRYLMDHGGQPRDENWFWSIIHFRSETKTVYLDRPIPFLVKQ